jgi:TPR repeat protein
VRNALISVAVGLLVAVAVTGLPAKAQTAADAAFDMARALDGAGGGVSGDDLISALEGAAAAGQPLALWQLGTMYENGEGVAKDPVKAFGYFSQIANEHADVAPRSLEADIVAQSFVKVGEYYRDGLPDAGIAVDQQRSQALLMHAATYFGDAEAQYKIGLLYLQEEGGLGLNPLQSARWLSLAARKGHVGAQATLGDMLFNGTDGLSRQPVEGLMWLQIARDLSVGTIDESWITNMLNAAMSIAPSEQRAQALQMAQSYGPQFAGL